jgi:bacillithiol biosynthesis cysteine-adding enzyme BshC
LRGTRHFLPREELLRIARESPELLSPNVVLRPIVQDKVLPTVAYVAGPGEISYFAQVAPLYDHFNVIPPVIYPRASVTILDERVKRALDKYDLDILEMFGDPGLVTTKILNRIADVNVDQIFAQASQHVHQALTELKFGLRDIDQTLVGALEGATSKIDVSLGVLKEKTQSAQKRRHEAAVRQVERAIGSLLPNGALQERQLSVLHFMNKYGPDIVQWLSGELSIGTFQHQILEL